MPLKAPEVERLDIGLLIVEFGVASVEFGVAAVAGLVELYCVGMDAFWEDRLVALPRTFASSSSQYAHGDRHSYRDQ